MGKYVRLPEHLINRNTGPVTHETEVVVVSGVGAHRGKIGFRHADEGNKCVIYFGMRLWDERTFLIEKSRLRPATEDEAAYYFKHRIILVGKENEQAVQDAFFEANPLPPIDVLLGHVPDTTGLDRTFRYPKPPPLGLVMDRRTTRPN